MAEAELVREILEEGPSGYRRPKRPYRRIKAKRFVGWFARGFLFWLLLSAGMLWLVVGQEGYLLRDVKGLMAQRHADQAAPSPSTADLAVVRRLAMNPMGINTFLYQEVEEEKIRRTLQMIKDAGFGFVREQVAWQEFERGQKNSYWDERWQRSSWHNLDRLIDLVEEYGLQFMARVDYPPDWSMPPGTTWHATPPVNYEDYGDFVYTLAERYRGRIAYYQIWNEPNLTIEWGRQNVDAAAYVRLLKTGYARIKQADPGAYVIAAALAPTIEAGPANLSDLTYLRRMYEAGAKGHFDAIAVNPYGLRSGPEERSQSQTDVNFSRPLRAREIMVEFGDEATPIWAAETGWNTLPPSFPQRPAYGRVTGERQAEYTVQAVQRVQREWPWLDGMALWHFRMVDARMATQQSYYFGLVGDGFEPTQAWLDLSRLGNAAPALYPGVRQEYERGIKYGGGWSERTTVADGVEGVRRTSGSEAELQLRFYGSGISLSGSLGENARLELKLDQRDSQSLTGAARYPAPQGLSLAASLPVGFHELQLKIVGDVSVDAFTVTP